MFRSASIAAALWGLWGLTLVFSPVSQAQTVYVEGAANELGLLDIGTGNFTQIGTTQRTIFGMGFAPDGALYGLTSGPNARLQQIDPKTANTTTIGLVGQRATTAAMNNGTFDVLTNDFSSVFYSITPPSPSPTLINGSMPFSEDGLIAFDGSGNLFVGAVDPSLNDTLYKVDPKTGASTLLGSTGFFSIEAGLFVNGTLYGFDSGGDILTLDTTTGAATAVGVYNLPDNDAIVAIAARPATATPEPGTWALLASVGSASLFAVACPRRRRNKAQS